VCTHQGRHRISAHRYSVPLPAHVSRLATDEGFVRFNRTSHLIDSAVVLRVPDTMQHEPRRLLSYLKCARDLVRTYSVLAVRQQPHCGEPLIESDGAILEDCPDVNRELLPAFQARPHQPRLEKRQAVRGATRAFRAFWALRFRNYFQADRGVREVPDCLHQTTVNIGF
jgi:hypothetical protein